MNACSASALQLIRKRSAWSISAFPWRGCPRFSNMSSECGCPNWDTQGGLIFRRQALSAFGSSGPVKMSQIGQPKKDEAPKITPTFEIHRPLGHVLLCFATWNLEHNRNRLVYTHATGVLICPFHFRRYHMYSVQLTLVDKAASPQQRENTHQQWQHIKLEREEGGKYTRFRLSLQTLHNKGLREIETLLPSSW